MKRKNIIIKLLTIITMFFLLNNNNVIKAKVTTKTTTVSKAKKIVYTYNSKYSNYYNNQKILSKKTTYTYYSNKKLKSKQIKYYNKYSQYYKTTTISYNKKGIKIKTKTKLVKYLYNRVERKSFYQLYQAIYKKNNNNIYVYTDNYNAKEKKYIKKAITNINNVSGRTGKKTGKKANFKLVLTNNKNKANIIALTSNKIYRVNNATVLGQFKTNVAKKLVYVTRFTKTNDKNPLSTYIHELGHTLGMGHYVNISKNGNPKNVVSNNASIMGYNNISKPTINDTKELQYLYGKY
ncbi:hypothetical protein [Mycoplasma sp. P36-A1]|uniref:hypothetical protein n=1 Tax=Mycoplasma sp. P36-A1 TaxID=3252900 RepID=UPI003C2DB86B